MAEWDTTRQRLALEGMVRVGRRTPQTLYASFSDDLDDRTTNYPIGFVAEEDLSRFIAEAVQEKLKRLRRPADAEAWLADQLAQLPMDTDSVETRVSFEPGPEYGAYKTFLKPGRDGFEQVEKLAQEYGEMCAARALAEYEELTIVTKDEGGLHVLVGGVEVKPLAEVFPDGGAALREMGAGPLAVVHGLEDGEVVK